MIVSDSKSAIKNYDMGRISVAAAKILRQGQVPAEQISLMWSPAHQGLQGKEKAHTIAQGLTFRSTAADSPPPLEEPLSMEVEIKTFQDIATHYRYNRKVYMEAAKQLNKKKFSGENCKPWCFQTLTCTANGTRTCLIHNVSIATALQA